MSDKYSFCYTCGDCKYFKRGEGKQYIYGTCPFKKYNSRGRRENWLTCPEFQPRSGEFIDRQDVLNILISNWQDRDGDDAMQTSINAIRVMPATMRADYEKNDVQTVNAQPIVHGRWIETYGESWICSECGVESYVDEDWHRQDDKAYKMNFCHYCGAKMEAERK